MISRFVFACLLALGVAAVPAAIQPEPKFTGMAAAFEAWAQFHEKSYSGEEYEQRLKIFTDNAIRIEEHNAKKLSWTMGLTQFADLTADEFVAMQKLRQSRLGTEHSPAPLRHVRLSDDLPESVDWRDHGLVNPIKNQGQCGSCWSFSTIVSLEGQSAKKFGNLTSYSEQDLVDCVHSQKIPGDDQECCDGCNGGLMDSAFAYMIAKQSGEDATEAAYPYKGVDGTCAFSTMNVGPAIVLNYTDIAQGDEDSLKDAVANVGPISIAVDANMFWQFYQGGVFEPMFCNPDSLNHGVAIVGYGTDAGKNYWIVRNSWGASWGEKGYMRIVMGKNECGLASSAVYPNL